jgi:hypothetical protein
MFLEYQLHITTTSLLYPCWDMNCYSMDKVIELSFKEKTRGWIVSRIVIVILMYHRQKPIDSISLLDS